MSQNSRMGETTEEAIQLCGDDRLFGRRRDPAGVLQRDYQQLLPGKKRRAQKGDLKHTHQRSRHTRAENSLSIPTRRWKSDLAALLHAKKRASTCGWSSHRRTTLGVYTLLTKRIEEFPSKSKIRT